MNPPPHSLDRRRAKLNSVGLRGAVAALGIELSGEQLDAFEEFEERLYAANEVMNLTRVPREECWIRHFLDSLLFHDLIPASSELLDIGTGPGFPAWPLACARPDLRVTAIDSSGKMLGFLARNPLPNLSTAQVRAEEWSKREAFDFVTGRAVAPLPVQLELSAGLVRVGGVVVPMRTPADRPEFDRDPAVLGLRLEGVEERSLPETEIVRVFPVYRKVRPTPPRFPRTWAEIKRKSAI
jgi:16S rRNA (guanine527-N7)-methyltransferase